MDSLFNKSQSKTGHSSAQSDGTVLWPAAEQDLPKPGDENKSKDYTKK